jgi:hypothetical protein
MTHECQEAPGHQINKSERERERERERDLRRSAGDRRGRDRREGKMKRGGKALGGFYLYLLKGVHRIGF